MAGGRFPGDTPATIRQSLMDTARRTGEVANGLPVSASGRLQTDAILGGWGQYAPADPGTPPAAGNARYTPVTPSRVLDTREGKGAPVQRLGAGKSLHLQVAGAGGVPATGASAAVLNVTVTGATAPSYLTVYPHGSDRPTSSSLNFSAGDTVPNLVTTRLGGDGWVVIYNAGGDVDVIADVQGYYDDGSGAGNSNFTPLTPSRVLDTREPTGVAAKAPVAANSSIDVQITGRGGVPASGVSAVALNVTVADATAGSYLTVWPTGVTRPLASNLNFAARQIIPNMVVVPVGTGGKVSLYNAVGSTNVIADVVGWYGTAASARFTPLTPVRALDTRGGFSHTGAIGADQSIQLQLGNARGVPANATGVVLNVTVTDPTAGSFVALWPSDVTRPTASNLNFPSRLTIANMVTARLSGDGKVSIYNAVGSVNVIVDVVGYLV
jgi:hypothetical protein